MTLVEPRLIMRDRKHTLTRGVHKRALMSLSVRMYTQTTGNHATLCNQPSHTGCTTRRDRTSPSKKMLTLRLHLNKAHIDTDTSYSMNHSVLDDTSVYSNFRPTDAVVLRLL